MKITFEVNNNIPSDKEIRDFIEFVTQGLINNIDRTYSDYPVYRGDREFEYCDPDGFFIGSAKIEED